MLNDIKPAFSKKGLVFLLVLTLWSDAVLARFQYTTDSNGQKVIETTARSGEGIAAIVRELGLEPNWNDQSWIKSIQRANSSDIHPSSYEIVNPGSQLRIPAQALSMCRGYSDLLSRFSQTSTVNATMEEAPSTATVLEPTPELTSPQPAKIKIVEQPPVVAVKEVKTPEKSPLDLDLHLGLGFSTIRSTHSVGNSTLNSNLHGMASVILGFAPSRWTRMTLRTRGTYTDYIAPELVPLIQNNPLLADLGASFGIQIVKNTFVNVIWSTHQRHFVDNETVRLELLNPWVHGVGAEINGVLHNFGRTGIWYTLGGKYMLSGEDTVNVSDGWQGHFRLQYQPNPRERGLIIGAEYSYHDQDLIPIGTESSQVVHSLFGFAGYRF